jgi:hypothetical protein
MNCCSGLTDPVGVPMVVRSQAHASGTATSLSGDSVGSGARNVQVVLVACGAPTTAVESRNFARGGVQPGTGIDG